MAARLSFLLFLCIPGAADPTPGKLFQLVTLIGHKPLPPYETLRSLITSDKFYVLSFTKIYLPKIQ